MTQLRTFDTSALSQLNRALVGFDRIFNDRFFENLSNNYPPFNIEKVGENLYDIVIAVAGFEKHEINIEVEGDQLTVRGEKTTVESPAPEYLHRGLAFRDFERRFTLAEHMEVVKAEIKNGLLLIQVEREIPDELLPRKIEVIEVK